MNTIVNINIYPLSYCPIDNIKRLTYTNKIILNRNVLDHVTKLKLLDDGPLNIKIINKKAYGIFERVLGIEEFSAPDNIGYMSSHIMEELFIDIGDTVQLEYFKAPKGTFVVFKPKSKQFYDIKNIKECLEKNIIHNYPILEKNTSIIIKDELGNDITLIVKECKPYKIISTHNTDLEVDFESCEELQAIPPPNHSPIQNEVRKVNEAVEVDEVHTLSKAFTGLGRKLNDSDNININININKTRTRKNKFKSRYNKTITSSFKAFTGVGRRLDD